MNPARRTRLAPVAYALAGITIPATAGWAIVSRQFAGLVTLSVPYG